MGVFHLWYYVICLIPYLITSNTISFFLIVDLFVCFRSLLQGVGFSLAAARA